MFGFFKKKTEEVPKRTETSIINIDENINVNNQPIDIFNSPRPPLSWTDHKNSLIWEVKNKSNYEELFTYEEALEYAKSLNRRHYDKSGKWRVPTIDELMTLGVDKLFDYRNKSSNYQGRNDWKQKKESLRNGKLFVVKPISGFMNRQVESWFWSSTPVKDYSKGIKDIKVKRLITTSWAVNFFEGGNYHNSVDQKNSVLCVRDMKVEH